MCEGGAKKALEPAAYRRCGGGGQDRVYGKRITEKVLCRGEPWLLANAREKSCAKPAFGHRHGGGLDEETTNIREERWQHPQHRAGEGVYSKTQSRTNTTHSKKDDTQTRT